MKEFDIEKLERKNIYTVPEDLFENLQGRVLSGLKNDFDLEKLERKNIYAVTGNVYEDVQNKVISKLFPRKKAPIFKLNWAYGAAAAIALIFGATFVFNTNNETNGIQNSDTSYAAKSEVPKKESEIAYETLKSDLTSVEDNNQKPTGRGESKSIAREESAKQQKTVTPAVQSVSKKEESQMNEYLDSFSNSEISELASNSTQDVYLDLYN